MPRQIASVESGHVSRYHIGVDTVISSAPSPSPSEIEARKRRIRTVSLADQTADELRRMILLGELRAGHPVTQDGLANTLGVSTMPVREALLRLVGEGLVEAAPNRSFTVVSSRISDIRDIYWMHARLAGELARRACRNADGPTNLRLEEASREYERALAVNSPAGLERANLHFHREINRSADAPRLLFLLRMTLRFIPEGFYSTVQGWAEVSHDGHSEILEAMLERDEDRAERAAAKHVLDAGELLIERFSANGYWLTPNEKPATQ